MNNAEYVKKLGLNYRDLTAKLERHSEPENLYTWRILNKKTNKQIGSYTSFCKSDAITSIGEWLLQEDEEDAKASLRNALCTIALEFIDDVMNDDMQDRQSYIDKINKLLGKNICGIRHILFPDNVDETNIYVEWLGDTYLLGSVLVFRNTNSKKVTVHCNRIKAFVEKYPHPANNYSMANQLLYSLLETSCGRFHENFNFRNYKNSIDVLQDMARDVSEIIEPAECKFVLEYGYYDLNIYYKDKKYVLAYCNEDKTNFHKVESNIEEFVYDFLEDTINE